MGYVQERGQLFVDAGTEVYGGMIVGEHSRDKMIAKETSFINYYDANLTLKGLQIIYDKQKQD